jgi:LysR family nitrogen assimilation transcriptional regulator
MNLQRLRYFVAVATSGSVSAAARSLHVAQPAVSNRLRQLELDLGMRLLERHANGMNLTRAGMVFLPYAKDVVAAYDAGREALRNFGSGGRLILGCTQTLGVLVLPKVVAEYRGRSFTAELVTRQGSSVALMEDLHRRQLDAVLCYEVGDRAGLSIVPLFEHDLCLIGRPGLALADENGMIDFAALREVPLVLDPPNTSSRLLIREAEEHVGLKLKVVAEIELTNAKAELLMKHSYYSILPKELFREAVASGVLQAYAFRDIAIRLEAKLVMRIEDAELMRPLRAVVRQVADRLIREQGPDLRPSPGGVSPRGPIQFGGG